MKIKPQIYAKILLSSTKDGVDVNKVAKNFWFTLQKNKQYKELNNILNLLDQEWANESDSLLIKAYSEKALDQTELDSIKKKTEEMYKKKVIIKNIIKPGTIAGVVIKKDDREIDLSLSGKVNKLQKLLKVDTLETK